MGEQASSLGHLPGSKWRFDESVAQVFDDMLTRSIPSYTIMRSQVLDYAIRILRETGELIIDLGASRGESICSLLSRYGDKHRYVAVEIAPAMLAELRRRFDRGIAGNYVDICEHDLKLGFPPMAYLSAGLVVSVLTLQFIPIEYRQRIVADVYRSLRDGGAFILVEKVLGAGETIQALQIDAYHALKKSNGYSTEEVERKALALEGVMVPLTAAWNEDMLRRAGFRTFDCFYRAHNFAGWIAIKE
jgi:tRNA (cmo5U34)-methyltransferase